MINKLVPKRYYHSKSEWTSVRKHPYAARWFNALSHTFIWPIDETLAGITHPGQSEPENKENEGVLHISQTPRLEPHHQMQFNVTTRSSDILYYYMRVITKFIGLIYLHRNYRVDNNAVVSSKFWAPKWIKKKNLITFLEHLHQQQTKFCMPQLQKKKKLHLLMEEFNDIPVLLFQMQLYKTASQLLSITREKNHEFLAGRFNLYGHTTNIYIWFWRPP